MKKTTEWQAGYDECYNQMGFVGVGTGEPHEECDLSWIFYLILSLPLIVLAIAVLIALYRFSVMVFLQVINTSFI